MKQKHHGEKTKAFCRA